ncbi:MAG: Tol-Pal system protein TolB [Alphaproteobacteria bacterium]|nr:Tol-Pal system protein TolB [Alphaproteobacteria bacterium]
MFYKKILFSIICAFMINNSNALKIEIKQGEVKPEPIGISDFKGNNGQKISDIIRKDLNLSFLFVSISSDDINTIDLSNWKEKGARFLLYGKVNNNQVIFTLVDVITGKELFKNKEVNINTSNIREAAHTISDYVYERITNEVGYFNTKIVYVNTVQKSSGKKQSHRNTQLMIMDQDGANAKSITNGYELVLSPRFSPDGKSIAYIAYSNGTSSVFGKSAHVYIKNGNNSRKRLLEDSIMKEWIKKNNNKPISMTYAPRFSPDGQSVVFAVIINGTSAIYKYNMTDNKLIQLTQHKNIDTSPCYSPDGKSIVFTSNRAGTEELYVMNVDGSDQHKISQGEGKYSQPVWSPRGDLITFTKQIGNTFYIGVVKPDGSGERSIASGYLVESPVWSSNGRYIIYTYQSSAYENPQIVLMDLTGRYNRIIKTNGDASNPAWSPTITKK